MADVPANIIDVDDLAQEIRRVDGTNSLGAGALAEALMPFLSDRLTRQDPDIRRAALEEEAARPESEWHEDHGFVVWWCWRDGGWLGEPAWIGSPLCEDWPDYHTHWTPHPAAPLRALSEKTEAGNG